MCLRSTVSIVVFVLCLVVHAVPAASQDARLVEPADLIDVREVTEVQISPDARLVAYEVHDFVPLDSVRSSTRSGLWLAPSDGTRTGRRFTPLERDARTPRWSPDSRRLAFVTEGAEGTAQIFVQAVADGAARQVSHAATRISDFAWSPDGRTIAYSATAATSTRVESVDAVSKKVVRVVGTGSGPSVPNPTAIWLQDVDGGEAQRISGEDLSVREFAWSPDGRRFAALTKSEAGPGNQVVVINRATGAARVIAEGAGGFGTRRQVLDWSPDGSRVAFARTDPAGHIGYWIGVVSADGGPVVELMEDLDGTVMRAEWADGDALIVQTFERLTSFLRRIEVPSGDGAIVAEAYTSYPAFSVSADGESVAFLSETNDSPMEVWTVREGSANPIRITRLHPEMADLALGSVTEISWASTIDGEDIYGVLITPPRYTTDQSWPTVVQIHGGPHFHWGLGWLGDWHDWGQLLASNGYVVLLPNPRGSTGRTWGFAEAIGGNIGGIAYQDIMDGVDALVARGIADPLHLGVGGWSWGGFLTAWTVTQTDRFAAAVMGAGISNHFSHAGAPGTGRTDLEFRFGGEPYTHRASYEDRSPIMHVGSVTTPTMIVHGENDGKISVNQAWEFYTALHALGVDTRLVLYPGAGHRISDRAQRIDYLGRVLCWYDSHLRGQEDSCGA